MLDLLVVKVLLREANFADGSPCDQTNVKAVIEDKGKQHISVVGADLSSRHSRHETQNHGKSSERNEYCCLSNELHTIATNAGHGYGD